MKGAVGFSVASIGLKLKTSDIIAEVDRASVLRGACREGVELCCIGTKAKESQRALFVPLQCDCLVGGDRFGGVLVDANVVATAFAPKKGGESHPIRPRCEREREQAGFREALMSSGCDGVPLLVVQLALGCHLKEVAKCPKHVEACAFDVEPIEVGFSPLEGAVLDDLSKC